MQWNVCSYPRNCFHQQFWKKWIICLYYPGFSSGIELQLVAAAADPISEAWIRVAADSGDWIWLRLIPSCEWLPVAADSSPSTGLDFRLTYTLIYQVNLRTYSAKHIIFMVCFLPSDFSCHWSRFWLLLQEAWRSLRKLEEAWRSFKTLATIDSSCSGWFGLQWLIQDLRPIDYLQNFGHDDPW